MPDNRDEPQRFLGFPLRPAETTLHGTSSRPKADGQPAAGRPGGSDPQRDDREPQRVLGFPTRWFESIDTEWARRLLHPARSWKHRRIGPSDRSSR